MALLGALVVELCLVSFRKISFACSYLPGKANLHFVFWAALFASMSWLPSAAGYEGRMLGSVRGLAQMTIAFAAAALAMHWLADVRARRSEELIFEEDELPEIVSLKLNS
jgi:hypothetical protein